MIGSVIWIPYSIKDKKNTAPPENLIVWVNTYEWGVDLGYFDDFTFRMWWGTDDCFVSHWAHLDTPDNNPEIEEDLEEEKNNEYWGSGPFGDDQ